MKRYLLNRHSIIYLILLSFLSLMVVQFVWLRNTFRLKERDFDEQVKTTLRFFNNDFQDNIILNRNMMTVWDSHTVAPAVADTIRYAIDTCFQHKRLPDNYVFAIGVNRKKLFWASDSSYLRQLNESKFSLIALCREESGALELRLYFPHKRAYILSLLMPLLLFSGFSFLVLLLGFAGLIYLLRRQSRLSRVKNDFINNMAHELKTPLFTISIASRMLNEAGNQTSTAHSKYAQSIQQEVKRLNTLVDKILQAALLEQKKINLEKKRIDLHKVIQEAVRGFELIQAEKGGAIRLCLDAGQHWLEADETHIINTIYNLLDNAFKYSIGSPEILIQTSNAGDNILLSIKDNGIGFDAGTKQLIFERFFRAHTGNRHDVKGYGIGLSYVKSVVEAHRGMISVVSQLDKGSEFTLQFPFSRYE